MPTKREHNTSSRGRECCESTATREGERFNHDMYNHNNPCTKTCCRYSAVLNEVLFEFLDIMFLLLSLFFNRSMGRRQEPFKYLVLSGDLPGEGFWATATRYDDLVRRVKDLWGESFNPIFKYKLPASPEGAQEELRYHSADAAFRHHDGRPSKSGASSPRREKEESSVEAGGADDAAPAAAHPCDVKIHEAGITGMCYVVVDDACDFDLWLNGGSLLKMSEHTREDPLEAHHADYHAIDNPRFDPLTRKLYAFRKTTLEVPGVLTHDVDKHRDSYHPYYHTVTNKDGVFRFRSSPAVKHSEDDVVRTPVHSLIAPLTLVKLNVTAVLRHSNASEVILWSANSPLRGGSGWWGQLVLKAASAWGVHSPVLRYLDLTMGVQQMNITDVLNFRIWSDGVGLDRPELLVLEQAPPSDLCYDSFLKQEMLRHYACHPPAPADGASLDVLVKKLEQLEQEELDARVGRPQNVSVAGETPGVVEQYQNHVGGIPLHRLGLAPPPHSRNLLRRPTSPESPEKEQRAAKQASPLSGSAGGRPPTPTDGKGEERERDDNKAVRLLTEGGRATIGEMEAMLAELKRERRRTDALEELIKVERRLRVRPEDERPCSRPSRTAAGAAEGGAEGEMPRPSSALEEMEGLLAQMRREGRKTEALEELIRVERELREEEERNGVSGTNLYNGIIPELSNPNSLGSSVTRSPHPCSTTSPSAPQLGAGVRQGSALQCKGDVASPPPPCTFDATLPPQGSDPYLPSSYPEEIALEDPGSRRAPRPTAAVPKARMMDSCNPNAPVICSVRRPYDPRRMDPIAKGIQSGEYGPSYTTPAALTTMEQQMAAEEHQRRVAEQFRRQQELTRLYSDFPFGVIRRAEKVKTIAQTTDQRWRFLRENMSQLTSLAHAGVVAEDMTLQT
eukprot:gene7059-4999_t